MTSPGQIALFRFPFSNIPGSKLRPCPIIQKLPGKFEDWLVCMISSKLDQYIEGIDEIVSADSDDYIQSGLKGASIIRVSRIAVANQTLLLGSIGTISADRLKRIRANLSNLILQDS
jgi:mRNA interferase MazF